MIERVTQERNIMEKSLKKYKDKIYNSKKCDKNLNSKISFSVSTDFSNSIKIDYIGLIKELDNPTGFLSIIENICKHKDIHTLYIFNYDEELVLVNSRFYVFKEDIKDFCEIIYINK